MGRNAPVKKTAPLPGIAFRPFTEEDALLVARWRYPEPYAAYDLDPWNRDVLAALSRPENRYHAILRDGEVIGFFCLGEDARVPGWSYDDSALDFGMGLRPDLTGLAQGGLYLQSVLAHVAGEYPGSAFRATVAAWNQRAIRLTRRAGFSEIARFASTRSPTGEYVVLLTSGKR
jgi:[ribosomal protein S18]-alanine N-acetyltransferase